MIFVVFLDINNIHGKVKSEKVRRGKKRRKRSEHVFQSDLLTLCSSVKKARGGGAISVLLCGQNRDIYLTSTLIIRVAFPTTATDISCFMVMPPISNIPHHHKACLNDCMPLIK